MKISVYDSCPVFITHRFTLRLVRREDAAGLLRVYSDKTAQGYFNADNCTTVEMFRREDGDDGQGVGILRIDLMSRYEFPDVFDEILKTMLPELHDHFNCKHILTKALPYMERRRVALILHGFVPCRKPLIGHNGIEYGHYWAHRHVHAGT